MIRTTQAPHRIRRTARALLFFALTAMLSVSEAALLSLSDSPPFLITAVEPNILLTFDDSGSMAWSYLPDCVDGGTGCTAPYGATTLENTRRGCSRPLNGIAYDPNTTYQPAVNKDGQPLNVTETSFTAAYLNGFNTTGGTQNLSNGYRHKWEMNSAGTGYSVVGRCATGNTTGQAAFYHVYDPAGTACSPAANTNDNCYRRVTVSATSGPGNTDERQNFANWFSYYSTRNLAAKTAAGRAFARFANNVRVSGQHLNNATAGTGTGIMFTTTVGTMRKFEDGVPTGATYRADFFRRLYNSPAANSTPLRQAMYRAGEHFGSGNTGANSPYRDVPGDSATAERTCRQNFHIMMTDGYWNGSTGTFVTGNIDGVAHTLPDGTAYSTTQRPYTDAAPGVPASSTLADGSFQYWYRDLRTDLTNNVPTRMTDNTGTTTQNYWNPTNDPANWQHLVTFTIGLGIPGTLDATNTTTYNNLLNGTIGWPAPADGNITGANVDDLWHAALNSRGRYFSARDPGALVAAFTSIVNDVVDRISSATAVAVNTGSISSNSYVYQSRFNSGDWSGQLLAYYINPSTGSLSGSATWDGGQILNGQNYDTGREILTYKPSSGRGIRFRWPTNPAAPTSTELDTAQTTALKFNPITGITETDAAGQARLNYLRGDASNESGGLGFRPRARQCGMTACPAGTNTGTLGDTINSEPLYVGAPPFLYPDSLESQPYKAYKSAQAGRAPMVYIGANDGMLHGFDASTGHEQFAYVPSEVYDNLSRLTATAYAHRYYVDGNPVAGDVFINGQWHTILVGGLRKGGQGVFALDITNPGSLSEGNANNVVLWEFNDTQDRELGYTYSKPVIARMANGKWAVIFGNGYNNTESDGAATTSATGTAALYILFIENGMDGTWSVGDFVKIDTGVGTVGTPNGLASPAVVDVNGDFITDYIYAGDLQGNLWRFDVRSNNTANWNPANSRIVFTANNGTAQPITSRPEVTFHPAGLPGLMVYFGTGKYIETTDASTVGATTQTFYGIWDNTAASNSFTRAGLLQQTVVLTTSSGGVDFRAVSDNPITWRTSGSASGYYGWYIDLPIVGERVVTDSFVSDGTLVFSTAIPSTDPCSAGGEGWVMMVDPSNGGRLDDSPFDVNGDGSFSAADQLLIPAGGGTTTPGAAGGMRVTGGVPSAPVIVNAGNPYGPGGGTACAGQACGYTGGKPDVQKDPLKTKYCNWCRASWRQIR